MKSSHKTIKWFRDRLLAWAEQQLRNYPWRTTNDPYQILVAEFLLQRTDADKVLPIYETFITRYPTIEKLAIADLSALQELLQPLGLFFRAERLSQTARIITEEYQQIVPDREATLFKLPGIGKYTARAICSQAFDRPVAVLDTNVARIIERFFGIVGGRVKSRCKILWSTADQIAPQCRVGYWNLTLLDFGAKVCTARKPRCSQCPLAQKCYWLKVTVRDL